MTTKKPIPPKTEAEWAAYRCRLSCKIGRDVLEGKTQPPDTVNRLEYAVFNLLHAMEDLSRAIESQGVSASNRIAQIEKGLDNAGQIISSLASELP